MTMSFKRKIKFKAMIKLNHSIDTFHSIYYYPRSLRFQGKKVDYVTVASKSIDEAYSNLNPVQEATYNYISRI